MAKLGSTFPGCAVERPEVGGWMLAAARYTVKG